MGSTESVLCSHIIIVSYLKRSLSSIPAPWQPRFPSIQSESPRSSNLGFNAHGVGFGDKDVVRNKRVTLSMAFIFAQVAAFIHSSIAGVTKREGKIIAAWYQNILAPSSTDAEARAILIGAKIAQNFGWTGVIPIGCLWGDPCNQQASSVTLGMPSGSCRSTISVRPFCVMALYLAAQRT